MKIARFGLLCCLLTSLAFSADTQTNSNSSKPLDSNQTDNRSTKPIKPTEIKTEAKESISRIPSPYEIASLISENPLTDLKGIWLQLGIKTLNFGSGSNSEGGPIESFLNKCNNCDVDTYSCDLDGEPGKDVLLKVSDPLAESWRYLVFRQIKIRGSKPEWKLLGHIDHGFGRYRMPEHSIFYGSGRNFLVIKVQEGSGSGFAAYYDRLFQVETTGLKEIMSFPSEGHLSTCCYHPTREFSTQIRKCEVKNGVVTVELEFPFRTQTVTAVCCSGRKLKRQSTQERCLRIALCWIELSPTYQKRRLLPYTLARED